MKLKKITEAQTLMPRQQHDSAASKIAHQILTNAKKHFHEDDHLPAAKKMANNFHKMLLKHIEDHHRTANMKEVEPVREHKFSLVEDRKTLKQFLVDLAPKTV